MPALSNQKHERFAQQMAMPGAEQVPAYVAAGFGGKTKRSQESAASNLMRRPDIRARIVEIRHDRDRDVAVDVDRMIRQLGPLEDMFKAAGRAKRLAEVARKVEVVWMERAAHPDYQDIPGGAQGIVVLTSQKGAVKKSATDTRGIATYQGLFEGIARHLGQWVDKAETMQVRKLDDLSDEELDKLIEDARVVNAKEEAAKLAGKPAESVQ